MTYQEITQVIDFFGKINVNDMEIQDQALYLMALSKFAETTKPIMIKYADKVKDAKFLLKL